MRTQSSDTHPEIERRLIEAYRTMTPSQKLSRVVEMTRAVQQMALARLRSTYPGASDRELTLHLASLWIDRETMIRAFDWDPEEKGY